MRNTRTFIGFWWDEWLGRMRFFPLSPSFPVRPAGAGDLRQQ
jgi:hypothetical protein